MNCIRVRNWDKWQSYRKDRGQPPWIKLHRCVMRNPEWVSLTDAQRGQLVAIWLLAAENNGVIVTPSRRQLDANAEIRAASALIQRLCLMEKPPDLEVFEQLGFIEYDANLTPSRRQLDAPELELDTETDVDTETEYNIPQNAGVSVPQTAVRKPPAKRNGQLSAQQQAWFEEFWQRYPRKKDKGSALKAWGKLNVDDEMWAKMKNTWEWQIAEFQQKDIKYVPYPATYLNAQGWESEPDQQTFAKAPGVFSNPNDEDIPF